MADNELDERVHELRESVGKENGDKKETKHSGPGRKPRRIVADISTVDLTQPTQGGIKPSRHGRLQRKIRNVITDQGCPRESDGQSGDRQANKHGLGNGSGNDRSRPSMGAFQYGGLVAGKLHEFLCRAERPFRESVPRTHPLGFGGVLAGAAGAVKGRKRERKVGATERGGAALGLSFFAKYPSKSEFRNRLCIRPRP